MKLINTIFLILITFSLLGCKEESFWYGDASLENCTVEEDKLKCPDIYFNRENETGHINSQFISLDDPNGELPNFDFVKQIKLEMFEKNGDDFFGEEEYMRDFLLMITVINENEDVRPLINTDGLEHMGQFQRVQNNVWIEGYSIESFPNVLKDNTRYAKQSTIIFKNTNITSDVLEDIVSYGSDNSISFRNTNLDGKILDGRIEDVSECEIDNILESCYQ